MEKYICSDYIKLIDTLKTIPFKGFGEYEAWHAICIFIYRHMSGSIKREKEKSFITKKRKDLHFIKRYYKALSTHSYELRNIELVNDKNLFFFSDYYDTRNDMKELVDNVYAVLDNSQMVYPKLIQKKTFKFKYLFLVLSWFYSINRISISDDLKYYILKILSLSYLFKECIDRNEQQLISAASLLSLNDENYNENLLFQFFKRNGKSTATLQHGHFWNTKNGDNLIYYAHNFKELTADYLFAWGQYTCDLAIKDGVNPDRLKPLGMPKYCKHFEKLSVRHEKVFGVFFNTPGIGRESNIKMIKIANYLFQNYGYEYYVKLHPTDEESAYGDVFFERGFRGFAEPMSVLSFSQMIDFSIVCASTVLFEQLYFNKPAFRYCPEGEIDLFEGLEFAAFSNFEQLDNVFSGYINDETEFLRLFSQLSEYCCGKGNIAENYRQAVNNLKTNENKGEL